MPWSTRDISRGRTTFKSQSKLFLKFAVIYILTFSKLIFDKKF